MSEQKIALITGANKGIGLETARQLGKQGFHVLIGARDREKGLRALDVLADDGVYGDFVHLDMNDSITFQAAHDEIAAKFGKLDVLVNNAGIFIEDRGTKPSEIPLDAWRETFDTNLFGVVELTTVLLPLIRKSEAGRIVNLSSLLASSTLHSDPSSPIYEGKTAAYNASKTALNSWTIHLAHELKDTPIKVNAADPGWVQTDMGGPNAPLAVSEGARTSVELATLGPDGPTGQYIHLGETRPW